MFKKVIFETWLKLVTQTTALEYSLNTRVSNVTLLFDQETGKNERRASADSWLTCK